MTAPIDITFTPGTTITTEWCNGVNDYVNSSRTSDEINYTLPLTNSVVETLTEKLTQYVSVKDFGAVGDGSTNDTIAINNALSSVTNTKKAVYFPAGIYLYNGGGIVNNGVVLFGDGKYSTFIKSALATPTDGYLFNVTGWYGAGIRGMCFNAAVTQTGGSYVKLTGPQSFIDDFQMIGDINGILMLGVASRIRHGYFQTSAANAIRIRAEGGDCSQLIDDVVMEAQSPQIAFAGIRVRNSGALIISNTSVITQGYGLLIDPTVGSLTFGASDGDVFSLYVNNCFFDNNTNNGIRVSPSGTASVARCRFSNCWASSSGSDGIFVDNLGSGLLQGMYFDSCHAILNTDSGLSCGTDVADIVVNGGLYAGNTYGCYFSPSVYNSRICNATIGSGGGVTGNTSHGIVINTPDSGFVVTSNIIIDNGGDGVVCSGSATGYVITDNFIVGNASPLSLSSVSDRVVKNNVGVDSPDMASGTSHIASGATSVVVTHNLGITPAAQNILISPASSWGSNGLYLDTTTITSTQFTIKCPSAASGDIYFTWQARINNN